MRALDLRAAGLREAVLFFAGEDLARDAPELFARVVLDFPRELDAFERDVEVFARDLVEPLRALVLRLAVDLRAALERDVPDVPVEPELDAEASLGFHLPDITRCAASATASAMIEPNLVALAIMLLAALDAVSAASSPASRILRRAAGLALIAAAAAARPAASISLLIAALASLSTVSLELEPEDFLDLEDDLEELLRADFAIFSLRPSQEETL